MLSKDQVIRAWKDPEYRDSLGEAEREALPPYPGGGSEITDAELEAAAGGTLTYWIRPSGTSTDITDFGNPIWPYAPPDIQA